MTQAEINKNAVADVMALEDAMSIYEAIGQINDDFTGADQFSDPVEYSADDLLGVAANGNDPMGVIPDLSGASDEMDEETQKFVVDKFAEMAANLPGDTIDMADITPIATVIKAENGIKQDVNSFLEKMMMNANQRLSAQNVSEAQPNGSAIDFNNDDTAGVGSEMDAFGGIDGIAGIEGLDAAPGGVEAPAEPSLDANIGGEEPSFDGIGDELSEGDASFGMEGDAGLGGDEFGAAGDDAGFDTAAIDDALGEAPAAEGDEFGSDLPAEGGEDVPEVGDEGFGEAAPAEEGAPVEGDEEGLPPEDDAGLPPEDDGEFSEGIGEEPEMDDSEFEATMTKATAQLESIRDKYIHERAASKIRSIVESFQARESEAAKKAKLESIVKKYKASEAAKESASKVDAKLESIVNNYAEKVNPAFESVDHDAKVKAQLESIAANYKAGLAREQAARDAKKARMEAAARSERNLKAQLESISAGYHGSIRKEAETKAQLESIIANYKKSDEYRALNESVAAPKAEKSPLQAKLDSIISSVK